MVAREIIAKNGKETKRQPILFLGLILVSVGVNYLIPATFSSLFFLFCLVIYFFSDNEPFWLAFFLVLGDGFFGLFGPGKVLQSVIPGLPEVEIIQLYILLTIAKTFKQKIHTPPFYYRFLWVLLIYLIFLIIQGYVVGISMELNIQFRLIKSILPLFLLYSIPKLFLKSEDYETCMTYLFPIAFFALGAQIATIATGLQPIHFLSLSAEHVDTFELTDERIYRGFFNVGIVLITTLGAVYMLTQSNKSISSAYLFAVLIANGLSIFLSATRGWIIGFSFIILTYIIFISGVQLKNLIKISFVGAIAILIILSVPALKLQTSNAFNRILTLEAIVEGDLTAKGTLIRLERRVPRVMKKWRESPITGWGFSNEYFSYADGHVGNHNLLLHSGITGALLMGAFFVFFNTKIFIRSRNDFIPLEYRNCLLVFCVFFMGWFIIHSTSWQHFSFYQDPNVGLIQALFFSWAACTYEKAGKASKKLRVYKSEKPITSPSKIYA